MKLRTIQLIGAPGVGKGTQGRILGSIPNFMHCACGDILRNLPADSAMGGMFKEYSNRGELMPDKETVALWRQHMSRVIRAEQFDPQFDILILDGIPRSVRQAEMLQSDLNVIAVLHLRCTDPKQLVDRIQSRAFREGRRDDVNVDVIQARFKCYESQTAPLLDFYGSHRVHSINANQAPHEVLRDIIGILECLDGPLFECSPIEASA